MPSYYTGTSGTVTYTTEYKSWDKWATTYVDQCYPPKDTSKKPKRNKLGLPKGFKALWRTG